MPAEVQTLEAREARADFVRAALVVLDTFLEAHDADRKMLRRAPLSLLDSHPELYLALRELEGAKSRWRMYSLPDDMVRP